MRYLIGTIIYILVLSVGLPFWALCTMLRQSDVDWRVFRRVNVGKLSFLFDFRNTYHVKNEGIIMPFFIMFLMAYATIFSFVVMTIVYFSVYFESIAQMDFTLLIWVGIGAFIDFMLDAIILLATILTSKARLKEIDKLKPKK